MNLPHQDLTHIKKLGNSIVPISHNREAKFVEIPSAPPKSRTQIQLTLIYVCRDLTTGVCSTNNEVHMCKISKQMDGGIIVGENSSDI